MADRSEGIGLEIPQRNSDCTGEHPSWYPFQIQVDACEGDDPDPLPLTDRERTIGTREAIPWWPF